MVSVCDVVVVCVDFDICGGVYEERVRGGVE